SDATLSYIFGDTQARHTQEQTKIDSPYNTYKYIGLPPGPISNPGSEAIEAAIYPQESNYYFFLTKPDTGEAVFAKTLDEQNLNKGKYLK
ncbi:MAG: endolytic transglycosylase MltG, partial [Candidatus Portnoybacteria bacterium CG_4_9_14_3_um_filter_40_10]